jgi:hypothetical protein
MFLSAVSVLVIVQLSSEVPEGLMNYPVQEDADLLHMEGVFVTQLSSNDGKLNLTNCVGFDEFLFRERYSKDHIDLDFTILSIYTAIKITTSFSSISNKFTIYIYFFLHR